MADTALLSSISSNSTLSAIEMLTSAIDLDRVVPTKWEGDAAKLSSRVRGNGAFVKSVKAVIVDLEEAIGVIGEGKRKKRKVLPVAGKKKTANGQPKKDASTPGREGSPAPSATGSSSGEEEWDSEDFDDVALGDSGGSDSENGDAASDVYSSVYGSDAGGSDDEDDRPAPPKAKGKAVVAEKGKPAAKGIPAKGAGSKKNQAWEKQKDLDDEKPKNRMGQRARRV